MARKKQSTRSGRRPGAAPKKKSAPRLRVRSAAPQGNGDGLPARSTRVRHAAAAAPTDLPPFLVVGIGGSAGAFEPCQHLLAAMPADIGMSFIVVQHLAPRQTSSLPELLGAHARLPADQVIDGMALEANHIYVIPPGSEMLLMDGRLLLRPREEKGRPGQRPETTGRFVPVDTFFRSLAESARSRAIGVILSGTGSDGALGLKEVKAAGGITIAQDPRTANSDGMPRAAIATGAVDLVLPVDQIAAELVRFGRHPLARAAEPGHDAAREAAPGEAADAAVPPPHVEENLGRIFAMLRNTTGVDFTHYKLPTIRRRLHRRMVLHKIHSLGQYVAHLQHDPREVHSLYQDILINVTRYFRDPESFAALHQNVFPRIVADREEGQPLRIWVPGCSTGEECYSVAIELLEYLGERAASTPVQIFATDIGEHVIEHARSGTYPESIAVDVPPQRLRKYFTRSDGSYRINKHVRDMCIFARQDLTRDPPFSRLDLIVCRNVLIYLGQVLQKRLMTVFHYALRPTGFLMLGSAETVGHHADLFAVADKKHRIYRKKSGVRGELAFVPAGHAVPAAAAVAPGAAGRRHDVRVAGGGVHVEANRVLLARFTPPGVLVDSDYNVVQFRGQTGPYLEPAPGEASLNLLKMAREGLLYGLRTALHEARMREGPVRKEGLRVRADGSFRDVTLEVVPLAPSGDGRHFLIIFQDVTPPPPSAAQPPASGGGSRGRKGAKSAKKGRNGAKPDRGDARVQRLESELAASREYMQSMIQDLEAANEELQSANEEILSSNEELQSANEELDTAKEELQSTNEELNTLNDELHGRNEELSRANSDLLNLLASVHLAIVMVSSDLKVRRFTPVAERLLNLIPTDVGRPIGDIRPNFDSLDLGELIARSIDTVTTQEMSVKDREGRSFSLRIRPYKNIDNKIDGAVLALIDVEDQRRSEREAREAVARAVIAADSLGEAEALLDAVHAPLMVLGADYSVRTTNKAFRDTFDLADDKVEGQSVFFLLDGRWDTREFRGLLEQVLRRGKAENIQFDQKTLGGGNRRIRVNARRVSLQDGKEPVILLSIAVD